MFISPAYAQAFGDSANTLVQFAPFVLIFVVFSFFVIRPQQQKTKDHRSMLSALRRGDRVVTGGGIIGTVAKVVNNDEVLIDIADNTRVRVVRSTIVNVLAKTAPAAGAKDNGGDSGASDDAAKDETKDSAKAGG
ncbi:MAG: preprotein translocase subunit YajC [Alphaproteobacteria bacterium]|nr:preprotein translocase subunit YajC [Alphaproteobacteria bacterium]